MVATLLVDLSLGGQETEQLPGLAKTVKQAEKHCHKKDARTASVRIGC